MLPNHNSRPKFLNLTQIRLPLPAVVSILHRLSGVFLFLSLPIFLWLFQCSLAGTQQFERLAAFLSLPLVKLGLLVVLIAFFYHLCAGVRFLLLDIHVGVELPQARRSATAVLIVSAILTLLVALKLF